MSLLTFLSDRDTCKRCSANSATKLVVQPMERNRSKVSKGRRVLLATQWFQASNSLEASLSIDNVPSRLLLILQLRNSLGSLEGCKKVERGIKVGKVKTRSSQNTSLITMC